MKRSIPWTGLILLGVLFYVVTRPPSARAQLGAFSLSGDEDGGDSGLLANPRKFLSNPWKEDAGNIDSGPGLVDTFKSFQGGSSGGFLQKRAPTIAEMVDSDASMFGGGDDAGSIASRFDFDLPSFGANIDAGVKDAGPVVKPIVLIARPVREIIPLTAFTVPYAAVWGAVPDGLNADLHAALRADGGRVQGNALTKEQIAALWDTAARHRGWRAGAPAFLVGDVGLPVSAKLVALGVSREGRFYAAFVVPRDGQRMTSPRVVLAASGNIGKVTTPQPFRPTPKPVFRDAIDAAIKRIDVPFGMDPPRPGATHTIVVKGLAGARAEVHVQDARRPLCSELTLDERGQVTRSVPWSPVCDHKAIAAIDVDGDGVDEVIWQEGKRRVLRREDGTVVAEDPPGGR